MRESNSSFPRHSGSNLLFFVTLLFLSIYADQYTKQIAVDLLDRAGMIGFFHNTIQFTLVENRGGFLGIVSSYPEPVQFFLLYICVSMLLGGCLFFIFAGRGAKRKYTIPLIFVTGGGTGNLLDRIFNNGGVIDFISIGVGSIRTGIFNLADVFILAGSFLLGYLFLLQSDSSQSGGI